jgi:hypothetical protein
MKRTMLMVCVAASTMLMSYVAEAADAAGSSPIVYENPERTHSFSAQGAVIVGVPIESKRPHGDHDHQEHGQGSPLTECSTAEYRCIAMGRTALAVTPELKPTSVYTANGTVFTVESCLRTADDHCQVALISGDCQSVKPVGGALACAPRAKGEPGGPFASQVVYFIYNEDYGVTSFGIADTKLTGAEREAKARELVLQGVRGFLASP